MYHSLNQEEKKVVNNRSLKKRRNPRDYRGTQSTLHPIKNIIPSVFRKISKNIDESPNVVLETWKEIVGPKFAKMAYADSMRDGLLYIKVQNSTVLSLLKQHERKNLLTKLRQKFPNIEIKNIIFRLG